MLASSLGSASRWWRNMQLPFGHFCERKLLRKEEIYSTASTTADWELQKKTSSIKPKQNVKRPKLIQNWLRKEVIVSALVLMSDEFCTHTTTCTTHGWWLVRTRPRDVPSPRQCAQLGSNSMDLTERKIATRLLHQSRQWWRWIFFAQRTYELRQPTSLQSHPSTITILYRVVDSSGTRIAQRRQQIWSKAPPHSLIRDKYNVYIYLIFCFLRFKFDGRIMHSPTANTQKKKKQISRSMAKSSFWMENISRSDEIFFDGIRSRYPTLRSDWRWKIEWKIWLPVDKRHH